MDIDTKIINYIAEKGLVRTGELVKYFQEENFKERGSKGANFRTNEEVEISKSERTILRKLKQMTQEEGPLLVLNSDQIKKYGIEDTDGRAKYLTLRETVERKKHLDQIFELFTTGNVIDKKMVLNEIKRYQKRYVLFPSQLDVIVSNLDCEDAELIENLFYILYIHIIDRGIKPGNETTFLEKLRILLERYPQGHENYTQLRSHILWFLGYYNDKAVIEQLKKDTETGKLSKFKADYLNILTSKVIEEARTELFYLENKLRKEGNIKTADTLDQIRSLATTNVEMKIEQEARWEFTFKGIKSTKSKDV